ncbi:MAG: type II secretion system F family protein [Planctomycetes bacterium]|nr:type II secretion system F family protein [Planctomycetota bacterium]
MSPVLLERATTPDASLAEVGVVATRDERLRIDELETLTRNLRLQLEAGVPLLRALESQQRDDGGRIDEIVVDVASQIQAGASFSEGLERWPRAFPEIYRGLVRAGERSGKLEAILGELASYLAWVRGVRKTVRRALVYPSIVTVAASGLILFVLTWLVPRFKPLFERLGDSLPAVTKVLIATSEVLRSNVQWIGVAAVGGVIALVILYKSDSSRRALGSLAARLPLTSGVIEAVESTRLMRNLSISSASGIPIVDAIEIARGACATSDFNHALESVHESLLQGESVSGAFAADGRFPKDMCSLLAVGEEAGKLTDILTRLADHYDEVAKERVDRFVQSLEPITTVVLGLVVGAVAVAILSTLYQVMQQAGR